MPLHLSSGYFTQILAISCECALLILGSKGQRSRSQCMDYKTIIIMKQSPNDSRVCPIDFGVKSSKAMVRMF